MRSKAGSGAVEGDARRGLSMGEARSGAFGTRARARQSIAASLLGHHARPARAFEPDSSLESARERLQETEPPDAQPGGYHQRDAHEKGEQPPPGRARGRPVVVHLKVERRTREDRLEVQSVEQLLGEANEVVVLRSIDRERPAEALPVHRVEVLERAELGPPFGVVRVTDDEGGRSRLARDQPEMLHRLHAAGGRWPRGSRQFGGVVAGLDANALEGVVERSRELRCLQRVERLQRRAGFALNQPMERSTTEPGGYRRSAPGERRGLSGERRGPRRLKEPTCTPSSCRRSTWALSG